MIQEYKALILQDLKKIAEELLAIYPTQKVFAFYGSLGSGKTTFIKEICNLLQVTDVVNSPTFSIINEYFTIDGESIYHFDFYRIESISEAFDLGYEDYIYSGSYCFIEWPERVHQLIPDSALKVYLEVNDNRKERTIKF